MKISDISAPRDLSVKFAGDNTLNVTYDAAALTPEMEERLSEAREAEQLVELTLAIVNDWDLVEDGTDTKVELTRDRLMKLPLVVLATTVRAISRDIATEVSAEGKA